MQRAAAAVAVGLVVVGASGAAHAGDSTDLEGLKTLEVGVDAPVLTDGSEPVGGLRLYLGAAQERDHDADAGRSFGAGATGGFACDLACDRGLLWVGLAGRGHRYWGRGTRHVLFVHLEAQALGHGDDDLVWTAAGRVEAGFAYGGVLHAFVGATVALDGSWWVGPGVGLHLPFWLLI